MASVWRIFPLFFVITFFVGTINAAALQTSETTDLDGIANKESSDATTYHPIEPGHVDDAKVTFDLYPSQQPHESTPLKDESDKNVQLVINQPNASGPNAIREGEIIATEIPQAANPLQLIPPASVNATIKQLEKESKQKQSQIIIRYAIYPLT